MREEVCRVPAMQGLGGCGGAACSGLWRWTNLVAAYHGAWRVGYDAVVGAVDDRGSGGHDA